MARRENVSWETSALIKAWIKVQQDQDWNKFSADMLSSGPPEGYNDSDLRRQVGLLKHQLDKQGFEVPAVPPVPKKNKGSKIAGIAEELGLSRKK